MDVTELATYADLISLSSHKVYGPQGIGALYIPRRLQDRMEPLIYGGGQQNSLRSGTVPVALCIGMAAALDILRLPDAGKERKRVRRQRDEFVDLLQGSRFPVGINGPTDHRRHPGNANLQCNGFNASDILNSMQPYLAASTGAACTSGMPEPSHVLRAIGCNTAQADSSIRFSFGRFTTDNDVVEAARLVTMSLESEIGCIPSSC